MIAAPSDQLRFEKLIRPAMERRYEHNREHYNKTEGPEFFENVVLQAMEAREMRMELVFNRDAQGNSIFQKELLAAIRRRR